MKKKALAVLLTASVIAGTMGGTATIVHADEEGKSKKEPLSKKE